MRNLKLSFALVIAVAAVAFTAITKANTFGQKMATDCYATTIPLTNIAGTQTPDLVINELRASVLTDVTNAPYLRDDLPVAPIDPAVPCPSTAKFCCARFALVTTAGVPEVELNGVLGKWQVIEIKYKD